MILNVTVLYLGSEFAACAQVVEQATCPVLQQQGWPSYTLGSRFGHLTSTIVGLATCTVLTEGSGVDYLFCIQALQFATSAGHIQWGWPLLLCFDSGVDHHMLKQLIRPPVLCIQCGWPPLLCLDSSVYDHHILKMVELATSAVLKQLIEFTTLLLYFATLTSDKHRKKFVCVLETPCT